MKREKKQMGFKPGIAVSWAVRSDGNVKKGQPSLICFFFGYLFIYLFTDFLIVHYSTKLFCLATLKVNLSPPLLSTRLSLPLGFQDGSWDFALVPDRSLVWCMSRGSLLVWRWMLQDQGRFRSVLKTCEWRWVYDRVVTACTHTHTHTHTHTLIYTRTFLISTHYAHYIHTYLIRDHTYIIRDILPIFHINLQILWISSIRGQLTMFRFCYRGFLFKQSWLLIWDEPSFAAGTCVQWWINAQARRTRAWAPRSTWARKEEWGPCNLCNCMGPQITWAHTTHHGDLRVGSHFADKSHQLVSTSREYFI